MEFLKVYQEDKTEVINLFERFDPDTLTRIKLEKLFEKHFESKEDYFGVKITDKGKIIAYLGLIFNDRLVNSQSHTFCNLTSLIIDPNYRGQKLVYKIIQYVQSLGNFTLTAITPIPALYKMYERNGFKPLRDERLLLYPLKEKVNSEFELIEQEEDIRPFLSGEKLKIYQAHSRFPCRLILFKGQGKSCLVLLKGQQFQKRRFVSSKWVNYLDYALRKLGGKGFLGKTCEVQEIQYASDQSFLLSNINEFAQLFFASYPEKYLDLRLEWLEGKALPYRGKSSLFHHSRQLFYSKVIQSSQYDILYSEIFVLEM